MTKFNNYLNEHKNIDQFIKTIVNDCTQIIDLYKQFHFMKGFYRGVKMPPHLDKMTPRKDRRPSDMPLDIHKDLDTLFQKKFGWRPRSEGVFTTSDKVQTEEYGLPYVLFPSNGFQVVYDPNIEDLFKHLQNIGIVEDQLWFDREKWEKDKSDILKGYTNRNPKTALMGGVEVMFKCKYYYLLREEYFCDRFKYIWNLLTT